MLNILYEDHDLIAVNKPPGLLSVPGLVSPDNLHDRVKKEFPNARVIHRLDMATSGIILFALNYETQKNMGKLFETRKIQKHYLAEVYGKIKPNNGEINVPMICDWENRPKQKVDWLGGKKALTYFDVLDRKKHSTRVELKPQTGRSHQLRVHAYCIGHPIIGDHLYFFEDSHLKENRLLLHAKEISFDHPTTGKHFKVTCLPSF